MSIPLEARAIQEEERIFQQEVQAVNSWWMKDRFRLVSRPYTAQEGINTGATDNRY